MKSERLQKYSFCDVVSNQQEIKTRSLKINESELHGSESEGYCSKFSSAYRAMFPRQLWGRTHAFERESNIQQALCCQDSGTFLSFSSFSASHFLFQTLTLFTGILGTWMGFFMAGNVRQSDKVLSSLNTVM